MMPMIIRKITKLQYLHMFIRKILTKTLFKQTFLPLSQSFMYPLTFFTNKPKPKPVEKPTSAPKKYDSSVTRREKQIQSDYITDQIIETKNIMARAIDKQHRFQIEEKENIRKILKNFNHSQLKSLDLQNLETILNFYVAVLEDDIIIQEPKLQHVLYETFVKHFENMNLNRQAWKDLARMYRNMSKLGIVYPNLHSKLPSIVVRLLNRKQQWDANSFNLTNILVGLTHRQILIKDEKMAILSILSYFDKKYNQLEQKQKAYLIRALVNLNSQNRFGIGTQEEQNILSKFLHDLETGKHNLWSFLSFTILQNNTYPTTHKTMDKITHIIIREALELLDAKGIIRGELKVKQMLNMITNFSSKYSINRLSQAQKAKLFQFLKKQIEGEETIQAQASLSLMLSDNFFIDNLHAVRLLLEHSQTFPMTVRLAFQLTRVGLKVDSKHFIPIQSFQPRKIKIQVQNIILAEDLLILVIARMQLQINPKSQYYKQVCERYFAYFQSAVDQNYRLIISQMMKMPHTALYYMHKLFDLKPTFDLIDQKQILSKYSIQNKFIYLLIKYNGLQFAQQFRWYQNVSIQQLIHEVLLIQMKIPASQRFYSTNLLIFFNSYLQKCFKDSSSSKFLRFCNIKNIINYCLDLTRAIRQNGKVSYQSHTFTLYWQTVNFLLHHIDDLQADVQLKIFISQFLEILMFDSPSHFFTTHQFRAFLKRLLTVLEKIKPNYEAISKIVSRGILCGVLTESNFSQISLIVNINKDLFGEIKQIGELWLMKQEEKARYESMHEIVKYFNSAKKYSGVQFSALKEEIRKYDIDNLGKALQFYTLPVDQISREIYHFLINELRSRKFINLVQNNFHSILANINKYLYGLKDINEILSQILKIHLSNFDEFTIEYHLDIVSQAGKMKAFDRDYERLLLGTALRQSINPFTPPAVVSCLARNGFGFNYKELRQLQTIMKTAKVSWLQPFLLLEDQLLPELRKDVLIHVLHHQKVYHPSKNQTNNEYVHEHLDKKYPEIYQKSYFETLKKDKSFKNKSSFIVPPFNLAQQE